MARGGGRVLRYGATDADSPGHREGGGSFTWTQREIQVALDHEHARIVNGYYGSLLRLREAEGRAFEAQNDALRGYLLEHEPFRDALA